MRSGDPDGAPGVSATSGHTPVTNGDWEATWTWSSSPPTTRVRATWLRWDLTALPVPTDALVYTPAEWATVRARGDRFARMLERDVVLMMERG